MSAAARLRESAARVLPAQLARAGLELAIELGIAAAVRGAAPATAAALCVLRAAEELSVGSLSDRAATRALLGRRGGAWASRALRDGLLRVGLPAALALGPILVGALALDTASLPTLLVGLALAAPGAVAGLLLHLRFGALHAAAELAPPGEARALARRAPKGEPAIALALAFGAAWAAAALAPGGDGPKLALMSLASVVTRPYVLACWLEAALRCAAPAPPR